MSIITHSYIVLRSILHEQHRVFKRRWVLFSDIDRTAYRKDVDNQLLKDRIERGKWGLVYITGRHIDEVIPLLQKGKLKKPHAISTNVGTRLYYLKQESATKDESLLSAADFEEDHEFKIKAQERFNKKNVHKRGNAFITYAQTKFPDFNLKFQEHETEDRWDTIGTSLDPYKVSFNYKIPTTITAAEKKDFLSFIKVYFKGFCVVHSLDLDCPNGACWHLDVVPFAKDKCIKYLNQKLKVKGIIAGDSGNDIQMLFGKIGEATHDFLRICVGGATRDVLEEISKFNVRKEIASWVHRKESLSDDYLYAYVESRKDCLGPISLAQAMREVEIAHTTYLPTS